ncbi:peptidoglycan-associated lipoprotein Pal [Aliamphritea hakodatensis]|uniref:peptidoglycan-associated lipoprotein Pal n=1 Tax=Aliamphritea hakodatensis TaxID=2895352 RepID=UPI0022FD858A|nr:peptidoglycan-associated lipoprotein Pal [Aliamphritea hakodatensis]
MQAKNISKAVALALTVVWAAGCSTTSQNTTEGAAGDTSTTSTTSTASSSVSGNAMDQVKSLDNTFYFDFDQYTLKPEAVAALRGHAKYLASNPSAKVTLAGHADDRGTREYNIALGEKRAKAAARVLTINGVSSSQIEVISYGEEKPAVVGNNPSAWAQNRRAVLTY